MPKARNAVTVKRPGSNSAPASIASFETLVRKVKETFLLGRERIEQEMVQTYLQTGKYIHEHILYHEKRAGYGDKIISKLSERVGMSERSLSEILQVYRRIPSIPRSGAELKWSHLRKLAAISGDRLREEYTKRVIEGNWKAEKLIAVMKAELRHDSRSNGARSNGSSKN